MTANADEAMKKEEPLFTTSGNANLYNYYGNQHRGSS